MVDFLKHLTPAQRERIERLKTRHARDVAEFQRLTVDELIEKTTYYLKNAQFPLQYQPGEPVYDGVIAHVVIPELLRRLKEQPKGDLEAKPVEKVNPRDFEYDGTDYG